MNFRNYEALSLDLEPGIVLVQGRNGQGKSNLLEAVYMLAIAKSPRALADREVVRWQAADEDGYAQLSAVAQRDDGPVRVQIDFLGGVARDTNPGVEDAAGDLQQPLRKYLKVNGVPRRTSEVIGEINAVMFGAPDLDLVLGPPTVRRRYLDILISQIEHAYLMALQRYQRVLSQRNHLLKSLRDGRSKPGELDFWDDELAAAGGHIMARRAETVLILSEEAARVHRELSGNGSGLLIEYRPSLATEEALLGELGQIVSEEEMGLMLKRSVELQRERELAQGFTASGPHRDDLQVLLENMDAGVYASRGECRTVSLTMKLAEASYLKDRRGQEPVLLLDDVLSELDEPRRSHVLEWASKFEQCLITTTDIDLIDERYVSGSSRFTVSGGHVTQAG